MTRLALVVLLTLALLAAAGLIGWLHVAQLLGQLD